MDSIYNGFMFPVGVEAMSEAVNLVAKEMAPVVKQTEEGATYDAMLNKPHLTKLNLDQPAKKIHDWIRGLDSVPGEISFYLAIAKYVLKHILTASNAQRS